MVLRANSVSWTTAGAAKTLVLTEAFRVELCDVDPHYGNALVAGDTPEEYQDWYVTFERFQISTAFLVPYSALHHAAVDLGENI